MPRRRKRSALRRYVRRAGECENEIDDLRYQQMRDQLANSLARQLIVADPSGFHALCDRICQFLRTRAGVGVAAALFGLLCASVAAARHAQSGPMPPQPSPPAYAAAAVGRIYGHPKPAPIAKNKPAKKAGTIRVKRSETTNRPPARSKLEAAVKIRATRREATITAGAKPVVKIELSEARLHVKLP